MMIAIDLLDVRVPGNGPVGSVAGIRVVVDRVIAAQARKEWPVRIRLKQVEIGDIEIIQVGGLSVSARPVRILCT